MSVIALHILIRGTEVTPDNQGGAYEFILDNHLRLSEWKHIPIGQTTTRVNTNVEGLLFELDHVRVNPRLDNTYMVKRLTQALEAIDVRVSHPPHPTSMAVCFKPMGEIEDNVRFYLNRFGKLVFLSPITRPKLVYCKPKN